MWLRLHNNTRRAIKFPTDSFYVGPQVAPLRLCDGSPALGLRTGIEVNARYDTEVGGGQKTARAPGGGLTKTSRAHAPKPSPFNRGDVYSTAWLPAGGSVLFRVSPEHLAGHNALYVPYVFEGEHGGRASGSVEPRRRAYLSPETLAGAGGPEPRRVGVKFEVDGRADDSKFKVLLYVGERETELPVSGGRFVVPPDIQGYETVDVRFVSGARDVRFTSVHHSAFNADWVFGVDEKPFSDDLAASRTPDPPGKELLRIYHMTFIPRANSLSTQLVIKEYGEALKTACVCVDSWRQGDEKVLEQSFNFNLLPDRPEEAAYVYSSSGRRNYKLLFRRDPLKSIELDHWGVELREVLPGANGKGESLGDNLLTAEGPGPGGDNFPREDLIGYLYPKVDPHIFRGDRLHFYPINAKRVIKVEDFYLILQVENYQFNARESNALDSLNLRVQFRNRYDENRCTDKAGRESWSAANPR